MPMRLHAVVEHAYNFDDAWLQRAIEDDVHRLGDGRFKVFVAAVADVKAANAGEQVFTISSRAAFRVASDTAQGGGQQRPIPNSGLLPVLLLARLENRSNVGFGGSGKAISPHVRSRDRGRSEVVEKSIEIAIRDFGVVALIERGGANLDRGA